MTYTTTTKTPRERFDELTNDYIDAQRMAMMAARNGTDHLTPNENTMRFAADELATFVMMHLEAIRDALETARDGRK